MHALVPIERLSLLLSREARLFDIIGEHLILRGDKPPDMETIDRLKPGDTFQGFECMLSTEEFYAGLEATQESEPLTDIIHDEGEE